MAVSHPPPDPIPDLATSCVRFVEKAVGVAPDGTQDTLPLLDHYIRQIPADSADEVLGLVVPACGAYFGEVVRASLGGGRWHCPGDDYAAWYVEINASAVRFNPIGVALEVATQADAAGWAANFSLPDKKLREAAEAAVARMGEVDPAVYYTFSMRFEVLEQVHEDLSARKVGGTA